MKTLQTIANLSADVIKSQGGLELLTDLVQELEKELELIETNFNKLGLQEFKEFRILQAELIRVQLDLLNNRTWKFEE